ncbi:hypothetical protein BCR33DRAFT_723042 [Rhizoclosmatium globosum]|uniref:Uncharacterized protein n=1 Tax=Rhizoclosmatium globosum TaxID=329046 RepID=A0A1Y2BG82_9FUNG|nr:hypothetical protein BCR33DRAFT_723042 [Rhizoclosmatium globosum]|eukprot:ORY33828.1 hypothetical protein BCR33DRAFT_723042 [Rhizoclosmatium globosum]
MGCSISLRKPVHINQFKQGTAKLLGQNLERNSKQKTKKCLSSNRLMSTRTILDDAENMKDMSIVRMYGITEEGFSVLAHLHGFFS